MPPELSWNAPSFCGALDPCWTDSVAEAVRIGVPSGLSSSNFTGTTEPPLTLRVAVLSSGGRKTRLAKQQRVMCRPFERTRRFVVPPPAPTFTNCPGGKPRQLVKTWFGAVGSHVLIGITSWSTYPPGFA